MLVDYSDVKDSNNMILESGFYYSLSNDLIHWSTQRRFLDAVVRWTYVCGGGEPLLDVAVLDPDSESRNFETTGQRMYLYFVRFHYVVNAQGCFQTLNRDLDRVPIEFSATGAAAASASFSISRSSTSTGRSVTFDASSSKTVGDIPATYRWDLDGNGTFETSTGRVPRATRSYDTPGPLTIHLRVTDELGDSMETDRGLRVVDVRNSRKRCRRHVRQALPHRCTKPHHMSLRTWRESPTNPQPRRPRTSIVASSPFARNTEEGVVVGREADQRGKSGRRRNDRLCARRVLARPCGSQPPRARLDRSGRGKRAL
jgi:hypothetical protein